MRWRIALPLFASAALVLGQYTPDPKLEPWIVLHDPATDQVVKATGGLTAYQTPNLPLRIDTNYGNTREDVEPYGGVKPYKRFFLTQMEYTGPGRAIPEPGPDLKSVKLGFIGPIMSTVSVATGGKSHEEALGINMLRGARLAIEEANARGGYLKRKIPFELVTRNDNGLWGASGNEIVRMAYRDPVWAILGTIDGANSHIAIRVALKAELVMMNSGDTDPTFIETNIPWVMRCIGDDRQMGYLLIDYMIRKMDHRRIGIIRSSNRYGRFGVREVRESARLVKLLREEPFPGVVAGGPLFGRASFAGQAGTAAEGALFPWVGEPASAFRRSFAQRFGSQPDYAAACAYDSVHVVVAAIRKAGLNRARIRDAIAALPPYEGASGHIEWDEFGQNRRPPLLAVIRSGQVVPAPPR